MKKLELFTFFRYAKPWLKTGVFIGLHMLVLRGIIILEQHTTVSEFWLNTLILPSGLVSFAVLVTWGFKWYKVSYSQRVYAAASVINFILYLYFSAQLLALSGAIIN